METVKVHCSGESGCTNYLEVETGTNVEEFAANAKRVEEKAIRYGWKNIGGKIYCRFCANKQRT